MNKRTDIKLNFLIAVFIVIILLMVVINYG